MRLPRQVVVAAATIGIVTTLGNAVLPNSNNHGTAANAGQQVERQYGGNRRRELEEQRLKAYREGDAIYRETLRTGERRTVDRDAGTVIRTLLRRP